MTDKTVLVTGACGEIGQALVQGLSRRNGYRIVTADLAPLPDSIRALSAEHVQGDLVNRIKQFYDYDFDIIYHLAASLSSKAEVATEEAFAQGRTGCQEKQENEIQATHESVHGYYPP